MAHPPNPSANCEPTAVIRILLADIIEHPDYQIRDKTDATTVTRYADAMRVGTIFPPITVALINEAPVLVDGFHRVAAARRAGRLDVDAIVVTGSPDDLRWVAAEQNMKNGLPLRKAEARQVFRAYVDARRCFKGGNRVKSSREIQVDLQGLRSHQTFLNWMAQDYPAIRKRMGRDDEQQRHDGGEAALVKHEQALAQSAVEQINAAVASLRGLKSPEMRGGVIKAVEDAIGMIRNQAPWVPARDYEF